MVALRKKILRKNLKNRNANIKKNEMCYNISDLDDVSPIKNQLSEKTKRNNACLIKKIAKSCPDRRAEVYSHTLRNDDEKIKKKN